ncbi:hypothetical protein [Vibrio phage Va2]|nr:hypothetical protein [Vibrio phage Va2]
MSEGNKVKKNNLKHYEEEDLIKCPACGVEQEEKAIDHCVLGPRKGLPTTDQCTDCYHDFVVYYDLNAGKVAVHN